MLESSELALSKIALLMKEFNTYYWYHPQAKREFYLQLEKEWEERIMKEHLGYVEGKKMSDGIYTGYLKQT